MRRILVSLCLAGAAAAQLLDVHSEFQRVDPFGEVVHVDRMENPREILSPAVARNAWASFQVTSTIPQGPPSFLYIQQNPEFFEVKLYMERYAQTNGRWMPDKLEPVSMPVTLTLPGADAAIPQQTAITLWLDIWVPEKTPVGRMRIQAVLKSGNQWIIYPMEVRVMEAVVPRLEWKPGSVAPVNERADASICTSSAGEPSLPDTIRQIIRRNALQDAALARSHGVPYQPCEAPKPNAEWYLRIRDRLRVTP